MVIRIVFHSWGPEDDQATNHRVTNYANYLNKKNFSVKIHYGKTYKLFKYKLKSPKLINYFYLISELFSTDVLYIQRTCNILDLLIVKYARLLNVKILFDFDDAIYLSYKKSFNCGLKYILKDANCVTVGSHELKRYAIQFNYNVKIISSNYDQNIFYPRKKDNSKQYITIGWLGHGPVHTDNLKIIVEPLKYIGSRYKNIKLKIVSSLGSKEIYNLFDGIENLTVDYGLTNWAPIEKIVDETIEFDIGIMPLVDDEHNRCKCAQKLIEYNALGLPVIGSSVGENNFVIKHGKNGYLASDTDDWIKYLSILIEDEDLRREMGKYGYNYVQEKHTISKCGNDLLKEFINVNHKLSQNRQQN